MIQKHIFLFLVLCLLPLSGFAQKSEHVSTMKTTSSYFEFPLQSVYSSNSDSQNLNLRLLQNSTKFLDKKNTGKIIRDIGMGLTISSLTGLLLSSISYGVGFNKNEATVIIIGNVLLAISANSLLPGVVMWPIGASMMK